MVLSATQPIGKTTFFKDTHRMLDQLAKAKAEIDIASHHNIAVTKITANILYVVQKYVDETTIPCTEWALPEEVATVVIDEAKRQVAM